MKKQLLTAAGYMLTTFMVVIPMNTFGDEVIQKLIATGWLICLCLSCIVILELIIYGTSNTKDTSIRLNLVGAASGWVLALLPSYIDVHDLQPIYIHIGAQAGVWTIAKVMDWVRRKRDEHLIR